MDKSKIAITLFLSVFSAMLGLGVILPLLPSFAENLGATGLWIGIIFSGFSLSRTVFTPIVGRASDNIGRKRFICVGLVLYALISLLYPLAKDVYALTFVRLIHGFASSMVVPIAMAYMGDASDKGEEGAFMGILSTALFLGMGAGPFLGGFINDAFGVNSAFYTMAVLTALAFLIAFLFLPAADHIHQRRIKPLLSFKDLMKDNLIKGIFIFRAVIAMGRGGIMVFLPVFAARINISPSGIGMLISINIFLTAILQRPFGKLADRYNKLYLISFGSVIVALSMLLVPLCRSFKEMILLSVLMGIGGSFVIPPVQVLSVVVGDKVGMGTSMGMFNMAFSMGMTIAPLISGVIMDKLGLNFVFYVSGAITIVGALIFYYYFRKGEINSLFPQKRVYVSLMEEKR